MTDVVVAKSKIHERSILAAMLQSPRCIPLVMLSVTTDDFYYPVHQELFDLMLELADQDKLDPVIVLQRMMETGRAARLNVGPLLADLVGLAVIPGNVGVYAQRVRELSRVRRFKEMFERGLQVIEDTERGYWESTQNTPEGEIDLDRLQSAMAHVLLEGDLLVDEKMTDEHIEGLSSWSDFLSVQDTVQDWLVRDLFERQDIWMILGGEGGGKSWFSRQMCLTMGAGIHPFRWEERITPVRTLLIDLENADSMIRRQTRAIQHQALMLGDVEALNANTFIWRRQEGLNIREKPDELRLRAVIDRVRPEFVAIGSLYNSFKKGRDDWETAAEDVKEILNKLRARYNCAWMIEHHMPKGDGKDRPATPYGSSVWQRWVTHGRVLNKIGDNLYELASFRGDRDVRTVPAGLQRGGKFPWAPVWHKGDLDAMLELEEARDGHARRARR